MSDKRAPWENITIRISKTTKSKLESLAESTNRSRNFLAAEAIDEYVAVNEWQIAGIKQAIKEVAAGRVVPHDEVSAWIDSLGTDHGLPPPKSGA
jgi:predicted transcriptional regulator